MTFATLALVTLAGLVGPLLARPVRWRIPVIVGELVAGVVLGPTAIGALHSGNPTFTFLATIGFALVMFVAGSHVPVLDRRLRGSLGLGALRAAAVGVVAVPIALGLSHAFGTGHWQVYAVVIASSSAAFVLPVLDSSGAADDAVRQLVPQVAIADATSIVALPLAIEPSRAGHAALGALAVAAGAFVLYLVLRPLEGSGVGQRVRKLSTERGFAIELRVSLVMLFALAALAVHSQVSILLAGFSLGLVVAALGQPRRLAGQLFALTEGFLGPVFFVWLGASIDLHELGRHPRYVLLGVMLGVAAIALHAALRLTGLPMRLAVLSSAQLGVPIAAATLGEQRHLLAPGEPAALLLGALLTVAAATLAAPRPGGAANAPRAGVTSAG